MIVTMAPSISYRIFPLTLSLHSLFDHYHLILVAKSKMMLILSLHTLNCKRENRLRHQYQIDGEPYMGTTLIMKKDPLALTK